MFHNHLGKTPRDWGDAIPSLCKICGQQLVAKRGPIVAWHWAHPPQETGIPPCPDSEPETNWHLGWKKASRMMGWQIEACVSAEGCDFRLDAAYPSPQGKQKIRLGQKSKICREFVHTLSDTYLSKHETLIADGWEVQWIVDGDAFKNPDCRRAVHPWRWY